MKNLVIEGGEFLLETPRGKGGDQISKLAIKHLDISQLNIHIKYQQDLIIDEWVRSEEPSEASYLGGLGGCGRERGTSISKINP